MEKRKDLCIDCGVLVVRRARRCRPCANRRYPIDHPESAIRLTAWTKDPANREAKAALVKHYLSIPANRAEYDRRMANRKLNPRRGPDSHLWRGGITPEDIKQRGNIQYRKWRIAVYERDKFTCQRCGQIHGHLHAHHIVYWSMNPSLRFDISNGLTVCINCHSIIHGRPIRKNKTHDICPICGHRKTRKSKTCWRCRYPAPKIRICPQCNNPKANIYAKRCQQCYFKSRWKPQPHCLNCGQQLNDPRPKRCRKCYYKSRSKNSDRILVPELLRPISL
mgnify:CR=1 FL=1